MQRKPLKTQSDALPSLQVADMVQVPQGMETLALKLKLVVFLYISGFHYKAMTQHIKSSFAM